MSAWEGTCFLSEFLAPGPLERSYERHRWSQQPFQPAPQPCMFPAANNCSCLSQVLCSTSPLTSSGSRGGFTLRRSMALACSCSSDLPPPFLPSPRAAACRNHSRPSQVITPLSSLLPSHSLLVPSSLSLLLLDTLIFSISLTAWLLHKVSFCLPLPFCQLWLQWVSCDQS